MQSCTSKRLAAALLASALGLLLLGCREFVEPPERLLGRWETDAPSHAGRYFEIRPETLTIETSTGPYLVYPVESFEIERGKDDRVTYVVHYFDRAPVRTPLTLRLVEAGAADRVKIENHQEVWTRVGPAGGHP